ncbi:hypothetical protein LJC63_00810 [Ruminococcaceae bacterium OttesenSCG-928-L11]|nr:hypothetical protein [Ruminococcaceae bacterium OttesenSCG-928-L11]
MGIDYPTFEAEYAPKLAKNLFATEDDWYAAIAQASPYEGELATDTVLPTLPADEQMALRRKFGNNYMTYCLTSLIRRLEEVNQLNRQLQDLSAEDNAETYNSTVGEIIEKTQTYYTFLGSLPDDIRNFFMKLVAIARDKDSDTEVPVLLGSEVTLENLMPESYQAIRPKNYIMQLDAITNHLAALGSETQLRVGKRGTRPILTTVTLDMPNHMRIEGGGALSTYDKSIINGVTSLLESGNTVFSIPMLYHAMTGKQNPTVDEQLAEEISTKLEKMRRMMISIDLTEENEAQIITDENGERRITDVILDGYLLPLNKVSGKINGKHAELYQILQHPPIYTYSKMKRQLASVKLSLLGAPVNNNSTTIPLKTYLIQRIELMKNPRNKIVQTNILYESVYKELNASDANKTKKMRIRNYTTTILQYFVEQGYIRSFTEYKDGRSVAGIRIQPA